MASHNRRRLKRGLLQQDLENVSVPELWSLILEKLKTDSEHKSHHRRSDRARAMEWTPNKVLMNNLHTSKLPVAQEVTTGDQDVDDTVEAERGLIAERVLESSALLHGAKPDGEATHLDEVDCDESEEGLEQPVDLHVPHLDRANADEMSTKKPMQRTAHMRRVNKKFKVTEEPVTFVSEKSEEQFDDPEETTPTNVGLEQGHHGEPTKGPEPHPRRAKVATKLVRTPVSRDEDCSESEETQPTNQNMIETFQTAAATPQS